jgi:hypothetical protein
MEHSGVRSDKRQFDGLQEFILNLLSIICIMEVGTFHLPRLSNFTPTGLLPPFQGRSFSIKVISLGNPVGFTFWSLGL